MKVMSVLISITAMVVYFTSMVRCMPMTTPSIMDWEWDIEQSFCGPNLTNMMLRICNGAHNEPPVNSDGDVIQVIPSNGIVAECCDNPCTLRYLFQNYCKTEVFENN